MADKDTILEHLTRQGVSRRAFLKFCAVTCSMLALPKGAANVMAQTLGAAPRPTVLWLSSQECTGCSESLLRSFDPTVESLILDQLSLAYHNTLMVCSGAAAEKSRADAMAEAYGQYILVVDGAIPTENSGSWATIGGRATLDIVYEAIEGAALVVAMGTCAAYGGIPKASPNPSMAGGVGEFMDMGLLPQRLLVNVSGCPPIPEVITGVVAYYLTYGSLPELDKLNRPKVFYGQTVHDACLRRHHFEAGNFATSFDGPEARQGFCLLQLGCRGPETYNACSTIKWNRGTSFSVHTGHGCIGCSEPNFWDKGKLYPQRPV